MLNKGWLERGKNVIASQAPCTVINISILKITKTNEMYSKIQFPKMTVRHPMLQVYPLFQNI